MVTRLLVAASVLALAGRPAVAQDIIGGRVAPAPDGTSANGLSWSYGSAWGTDPVTLAPPERPDEGVVGRHAPDWYQAIDLTGAQRAVMVALIEGVVPDASSGTGSAGYVAIVEYEAPPGAAAPYQLPDGQLHPLPRPSVRAAANGRLLVEWPPVEEDVPGQWRSVVVEHALDPAGPWRTIAVAPADRLAALTDAPAACAGLVALRLVGPPAVETSVRSAAVLVGSGLVDADADGVADACDNCPATANPEQRDADGDGTGNACDASFVEPFVEIRRATEPGAGDTIVVHVVDPAAAVHVQWPPLLTPWAYDTRSYACVEPTGESVSIPLHALARLPLFVLAGTVDGTGLVDLGDDSTGADRPRATPATCP